MGVAWLHAVEGGRRDPVQPLPPEPAGLRTEPGTGPVRPMG